MGEHTEIQWCDATFLTRVSPGCENCYAETLAKRFNVRWGKNADRRFFGDKHWNEPVLWNRKAAKAGVPIKVFCASMADVFEDRRDLDDVRKRLFDMIPETPWLVWMLLTKRPENVLRMVPANWCYDSSLWPRNCWVGTTAELQKTADERLPYLVEIPAPVRFVSVEPMLGPVDLTGWLPIKLGPDGWRHDVLMRNVSRSFVDWIICGGESGSGARPMHPQWARSLRDQTVAAGVPFLFKQWGEWAPRVLAEDDTMGKVGKKSAGRVLDDRTWDEVPPLPTPDGRLV